MKTKTSRGFPEKYWKPIAGLINALYGNLERKDLEGVESAIRDLETILDELRVSPRQFVVIQNHSFKDWYGKLCDGFHFRDMRLVRSSVVGMRSVLEFYRKDSKWQSQRMRAA